MSCNGRRLLAAPRAALPHQKNAQRCGRIYEQLRREPDRANIKMSRKEGGRRKHQACPHQQDQHPMPSASDVRTTPSSKGQTAARVIHRPIEPRRTSSTTKSSSPIRIKTPTQNYSNYQQTYEEPPTPTAIQLPDMPNNQQGEAPPHNLLGGGKGRPRITPNNQQRRGGAPPNRRGGKYVLWPRQRVPIGKKLMGSTMITRGGKDKRSSWSADEGNRVCNTSEGGDESQNGKGQNKPTEE